MSETTAHLDQVDEEILIDDVSDDALEQVGDAGERKITNKQYGSLRFTPCC